MALLNTTRGILLTAGIALCSLAGLTPVSMVSNVQAASIFDSGFERKIKMTGSQRTKVRRIMRASNRRFNAIFRKYGINKNAAPKMSQLMDASGPLQSAARQERNELAKVLTPTQLQRYDAITKQTEDKIVRAAK